MDSIYRIVRQATTPLYRRLARMKGRPSRSAMKKHSRQVYGPARIKPGQWKLVSRGPLGEDYCEFFTLDRLDDVLYKRALTDHFSQDDLVLQEMDTGKLWAFPSYQAAVANLDSYGS